MDATIVGLVSGILGAIIGGAFAIWAANKQIKAILSQTQSDLHERLHSHNLDLVKFLAEHPNLYPYFVENRPLSDAKSKEEKAQIAFAADMMVGFLDLAAAHINKLPQELQPSWRNFIVDQYKESEVVRDHVDLYPTWYSPELLKLLSEAEKNKLLTD